MYTKNNSVSDPIFNAHTKLNSQDLSLIKGSLKDLEKCFPEARPSAKDRGPGNQPVN